MADVREMTRKELNCASSVIRASVKPSTKYSWVASPERFCSGRTAIERIGGTLRAKTRLRIPARLNAKAAAMNAASPRARTHARFQRNAAGLWRISGFVASELAG